jgi:hypothetical protein
MTPEQSEENLLSVGLKSRVKIGEQVKMNFDLK